MNAGKHALQSRIVGEDDLALAFLKALHCRNTRLLVSLLLTHRQELIGLASFLVRERLAVQSFVVLSQLKLQFLFPNDAWILIEDQWRQQQERSAKLLTELVRIQRAFDEVGIKYRLLKGLYLGECFYGGLERRFTWDIDLMVYPKDIWNAIEVLDRLGFHKPNCSMGLVRLAPWVAHALECQRADGLSADLHWGFRRLPGLHINYSELWRDRSTQLLAGLAFPVPPHDFTMLQLLLGVAADVDRGLCQMRAIWDVYMVIRSLPNFDWPSFLSQRERDGSVGMVTNALSLVLFRLNCHTEFPTITEVLDVYRGTITISSVERARMILARAPHSLENHRLFARWQPLPRWRYWFWWASTLPLRFFFARRI